MSAPAPHPRVAIVHEWFTSMRGGEKCVEALCEVFPDATLFALVHAPGSVSPTIERMPIRTSFIQRLPGSLENYRHFLPLFPAAVQRLDMSGFDIVISSNHCVAKGVRTATSTLHVCYCYTPMRYIWGLYDDYFGPGRAGVFTRMGMRAVRGYLRRWDVRTAMNPHRFIAISENVRSRIRDIYHRDSDLIYPPVETSALNISRTDDGYFLMVSALVPYKRVDLAVEAFNRTGDRLVVVGDGPEGAKLRNMAGSHVEFTGWLPDRDVRGLYAGCRAVIFPGEEDFGIVPVEAMACGKPVVAFARGGALETVLETRDLTTGVLFQEQNVEELVAAIRRCKERAFDPEALRHFALGFDREIYKSRMKEYVLRHWKQFRASSLQA
jgi:glycosyltransferase involved in cell wall biosynthesis